MQIELSRFWSKVHRVLALFSLILLIPKTLPASECAFLLAAMENRTTLANHWEQAEVLNEKLETALKSANLPATTDLPKLISATEDILQHAFQNTVQHGSHKMITQYEKARVSTYTSIYTDGSNIFVTISNPQIKPFPNALLREFTGLDFNDTDIPEFQRVGFKGVGIAHSHMIDDLRALPKGSTMAWEANGKTVRFVLKIRIPQN